MEKILVFVPMYNCEKQIVRVLKQLRGEIGGYITEVIIVNNRSTDKSEKVVINYLKKKVVSIPVTLLRNTNNYNLGGSHKVAWDYAVKGGFDYVITLHGDDQMSIADLLPYIKNGDYKKYDCLLGGRFCKGSRFKGYSKSRIFGNIVFNVLFSMATGTVIYDLGAGLNMYNTNMLKDKHYIKFNDGLTFNYYSILAIKLYGHKYKFFPISVREEDQTSNAKLIQHSFKMLKIVFSFVVNRKKFIKGEHRDIVYNEYSSDVIYKTTCGSVD